MRSESWCRRLCQDIRATYNYRHSKQLLKMEHFCNYQDLSAEEVSAVLNGGQKKAA